LNLFFLAACVALFVLAALFFVRPGRRTRRRAEAEANLEWYRLREAELRGEGDTALLEDARLRLLEDVPDGSAAPMPRPQGRFPALWLLPLVAVAAVVLYWQLGAATDVSLSRRLDQLSAQPAPAELDDLMGSIAARVRQRPDNLGYQALLGRYHMSQKNYAAAAEAYAALADGAPGDARALAMGAQARFLADGRQLQPAAQRLAEEALAIDPQQRTALGLLGMAAFENARYRAAIDYWERLAATEAPDSPAAGMLAEVIATARSRLGEGAGGEEPGTAAPEVAGAGITVSVAAPPAGLLDGTETVFVLARRDGATSRMPIAVQRFPAARLPLTLRLDDRHSMAGQKLSAAGAVRVFVQISPDGRPGLEHAVLSGTAGPVDASSDGSATLEVVLEPVNG
jgi:cytochrome c-type biogenesis protein CcmH